MVEQKNKDIPVLAIVDSNLEQKKKSGGELLQGNSSVTSKQIEKKQYYYHTYVKTEQGRKVS